MSLFALCFSKYFEIKENIQFPYLPETIAVFSPLYFLINIKVYLHQCCHFKSFSSAASITIMAENTTGGVL